MNSSGFRYPVSGTVKTGICTECSIKNAPTDAVKRWHGKSANSVVYRSRGIEEKSRKRKGRSVRHSPLRLLNDLSFRLVRPLSLSLFHLQVETVRSNRDEKGPNGRPGSRHFLHGRSSEGAFRFSCNVRENTLSSYAARC